MAEVLTVLTFKGVPNIVENLGTQSWKISRRRARRCTYVVCVRHQQGPHKAEGNEPHKHAFLVGKVSDVVPSNETKGRLRVAMSEYAVVDGPQIPLNSASPTQYFPSLSSIGIDETSLQWKPITELPGSGVSASPINKPASEHAPDDVSHGADITAMSVFMQAKKLVADNLHVPVSAVEITVRA